MIRSTIKPKINSLDLARHYYSAAFCLAILLLIFGGLGGSFQASRFVAAGILPFVLLSRAPPDGKRIIWRAFGWMSAAFLFFGVISLGWSWNVPRGIGIIGAVSVGLALVILAKHMDRSDIWLRRIRLSWCAVALMASIQGIYEIVSGNHFAYALENRNLGADLGDFPYAAGFFGNYNDFSVFLSMSLPFLLVSVISEKNALHRVLSAITYTAVIFILFANTSRGCIIFAIFVSIFISIKLLKKYFLVIFALFSFIFLVIYISGLTDFLMELLLIRLEYSGFSDSERLDIFWAGMEGVWDYWGLGMGAGSFESFMIINFPALIPNPHNIFLEIATNFGVISLLVFILWLFILFFSVKKSWQDVDTNKLIVRCSVLGVPVLGAVSSQAIVYIYWLCWLATITAFANSQGTEDRCRKYGLC